MSNFGYFKIPRELLLDPIFKGFSYEYRHIFLTILANVAFKPVKLDDHGVLIELKPGQFMTTVRDLARLCNEKDIDKSKIERALSKFFNVGFSRQETRHTKTIITITEPNICKLIESENETGSETRSRQDRDKIETQKKKEKKEKKENTIITDDLAIVENVDNFSLELNEGNFEALNESTQHNIYNQTTNSEENTNKVELKQKKSNKVKIKKEEDRLSFGEDGLVKLTEKEYADLLKHMKEPERDYWIQEVSLARGKNQQSFDKNYKSHYHTLISWKRFRDKNESSAPAYQKNTSIKDKILKHFEHGKIYNGYECCIDATGIGFLKGMHHCAFKFSDHGLCDQINGMMFKLGIDIRI